jgi:hypothetical protein
MSATLRRSVSWFSLPRPKVEIAAQQRNLDGCASPFSHDGDI